MVSIEIFLLVYLLVDWTFWFSGKAHRCYISGLLKCFNLPFLSLLQKTFILCLGLIFCAIYCMCHTTYTSFLGLDPLFLLHVPCSLYLIKFLVHVLYIHLMVSYFFVCLLLDVYNLFIGLQMVFEISVCFFSSGICLFISFGCLSQL